MYYLLPIIILWIQVIHGLCSTIDVLDESDISHTGTYQTEEDSNTILYKYVKGVKIAFLSYTYGTNGITIPDENSYCVNLIDEEAIKSDIELAKAGDADVIVALMHWGTEYSTTVTSSQEELTDFLFLNGVDVILGSHPHVLEPMETKTVTMEDGTIKECFVIYSLGNFISDQTATNTRTSIILDLEITVLNTGEISIDHAEYVPIYMYDDDSKSTNAMTVLDIEKSIETYDYELQNGTTTTISSTLYSFLQSELIRIEETVGVEF